MANAGELSFRTVAGLASNGLVIVSPNDPEAMVQYAGECSAMRVRYIWDPGQQCARMDGAGLRDGIVGAHLVVCNDYEFELIRQKTGMSEGDVLAEAETLIVTRGEHGCTVMTRSERLDVKAVPPDRIVDPTGVGDGFRAGLMKGLASGQSLVTSAQMGSVAATWVLEHLGGQSHAYSWPEFVQRYERHFGPLDL
jgi:adenosine kinase